MSHIYANISSDNDLSPVRHKSHYLNQCWNINWALRNTFCCNLNQCTKIAIQENELENVVPNIDHFVSASMCCDQIKGDNLLQLHPFCCPGDMSPRSAFYFLFVLFYGSNLCLNSLLPSALIWIQPSWWILVHMICRLLGSRSLHDISLKYVPKGSIDIKSALVQAITDGLLPASHKP